MLNPIPRSGTGNPPPPQLTFFEFHALWAPIALIRGPHYRTAVYAWGAYHTSLILRVPSIIYPTCKITNRISFARITNASDQFRVENRPPLKLNFRGGLFSNQSWSEAPGASYGHFSTSQVAPSMIGFCKFTSTLIGDHPVRRKASDFAKTLITLEP